MIKKILALRKEKIISGSFWLSGGTFLVNVGNYFFNLLMGRLLTPVEYGILATLISLSIIVSIPNTVIATVITKFSADFFAKRERPKISRLARKFTYYTALGSAAIFFSFVVFHQLIQSFLKIDDSRLVILTGAMVGFGLISSVNNGIFRGLLLFKLMTFFSILGMIIKLFLSWYLVSLNYAVFGALLAIFVSYALPWIISFWPIRDFFREKSKQLFGLRKKVLSFSLPTFSSTIFATLFLSSDLILVKHYFSGEEAGIYAATSIMGKAIFYALAPIANVFFSVIAQSFAQGKKLFKETILSFLLTVIPGLIAVSIYFFKSELIIKIFFPKKEYLATADILGPYAVYIFFYSLTFLFINFFLATERIKMSLLALLGVFLQISLIIFLHQSLLQVILVCLLVITLLLLLFILYSIKSLWQRKEQALL